LKWVDSQRLDLAALAPGDRLQFKTGHALGLALARGVERLEPGGKGLALPGLEQVEGVHLVAPQRGEDDDGVRARIAAYAAKPDFGGGLFFQHSPEGAAVLEVHDVELPVVVGGRSGDERQEEQDGQRPGAAPTDHVERVAAVRHPESLHGGALDELRAWSPAAAARVSCTRLTIRRLRGLANQ
jgi:hypothetical protein